MTLIMGFLGASVMELELECSGEMEEASGAKETRFRESLLGVSILGEVSSFGLATISLVSVIWLSAVLRI